MEAVPPLPDTVGMDTTQRIAALLSQARDITRDTLGATPPTVVAEVFRALYLDADMAPDAEDLGMDVPHAVH